MSLYDILSLKFPEADFTKDIILENNGQGDFIAKWNLQGQKPNQTQLNAWAIQFDLGHRQRLARQKRVYPPVTEQLDMQYWDKINNTTTWIDAITTIKQQHPIPAE